MHIDMEKARNWLDGPSSLVLSNGRAQRMLRIVPVVTLLLVLVYFYSNSQSDTNLFTGRHKLQTQPAADKPAPPATVGEKALMDAAGNATLGFGSIQFINLPARFDRIDAATLQAYLSGIDITEVPGVLAADINDAGMPPEHLSRVKKGEKGCWRAHANIWNQMLRDKTPSVLILESDAAWDVETRDIMRNLNQHFTHFLDAMNSKVLPNPGYVGRTMQPEAGTPLVLNADDPWHSTHWDLFSLGQCFEDSWNSDKSLRYADPHVKPGNDYFGQGLGAERVVRQSGGIVCTTAYAISQTGALKLLLRTAVDLDNPIDLVMRRMIKSGDLVTYSVMPTVFGQWEYIDNIGMTERGANSDIHGGNSEGALNLTGWENVSKNTGSVWKDREGHVDVAFQNMALEKAWEIVMGKSTLEASQFKEADGN